jgi:hypothetical protein
MFSSALKSFICQLRVETSGQGKEEHAFLLRLPRKAAVAGLGHIVKEEDAHPPTSSIQTTKIWVQGCVAEKRMVGKVHQAHVDDGTGTMQIRVHPKICCDFEETVKEGSYVLAHVVCGKNGKMLAHKFSVIEDANAETLWSFEVMDAQVHAMHTIELKGKQ